MGYLVNAVTSGIFGKFGVVKDFSKPVVGTEHFAATIQAGKDADAMQSVQDMATGIAAVGDALSGLSETEDFGPDPTGSGGSDEGTDPDPGGEMGGFSHGGRPPVGKPVIVGEQGTELFIPDQVAQLDFAGVSDEILKLIGAEQLAKSLGLDAPKDKKSDKKKAKTKIDTTPTQSANKPVKKAEEKRKAGRSDIERIFLELLNNQIRLGQERS